MKSATQDLEVQTPVPDPIPSLSPILSPRDNAFSVCQSPFFDPKNSTSGASLGMRSEALFDKSLERSIDDLSQQMDRSRVWQDAKFTRVLAQTRLLEAKLEHMQQERPNSLPKLPAASPRPSMGEYLAVEQQLEQQLSVIHDEMEAIQHEVTSITQCLAST